MSDLSRRHFLYRTALAGCSLAASPLVTPVSLAAAPWEQRFIVIILRGGMDGLDVVRPVGDPAYAALRPTLGKDRGLELDGYFTLHPELENLMPLWRAGDLGFVHAVSTPYRDKRSHFDGQDLLEAGTADLGSATRDGWLNRLLQSVPGLRAQTAYAIGTNDLQVLSGAAEVSRWSPEARLQMSPQADRLMELMYESDPDMLAAYTQARDLSASVVQTEGRQKGHLAIASFAAERLAAEARIAAFSINGWDTHRNQAQGMRRALRELSETIITLKEGLPKAIWGKTALVAMTEFGRTVRENGTKGTDHGTGGLMLLSGGAIRGGHVHGDWPELESNALYAGRDLMPTRDVRAHAAWVMRGLFGLERGTLETAVFPGLQMGSDPRLLL